MESVAIVLRNKKQPVVEPILALPKSCSQFMESLLFVPEKKLQKNQYIAEQ